MSSVSQPQSSRFSAELPASEQLRLAAVRRYDGLETPANGSFDRITALAARHFEVPIAIVSVVEADRVRFASHYGLEDDGIAIGRDLGLCASVVLQDQPWIVEDAPNDPRTLSHPLVVGEFSLRFYAGVPLRTHDGLNLGALCLVDRKPRRLTGEEAGTLVDMAAIVMDALEARLAARSVITDASVMALLLALEARDGYSAAHTQSVVSLALEVAEALGMPRDAQADVENAAWLHDVGKIGVADEILRKTGSLTESEQEQMRCHAAIGEQIVAAMPALSHLAPLVRVAHERWDGGGYPDGLRGLEIPLASRIVFVCDAYDAMTSDRPYRRALSQADALREIAARAGTQFCPDAARALIACAALDQ